MFLRTNFVPSQNVWWGTCTVLLCIFSVCWNNIANCVQSIDRPHVNFRHCQYFLLLDPWRSYFQTTSLNIFSYQCIWYWSRSESCPAVWLKLCRFIWNVLCVLYNTELIVFYDLAERTCYLSTNNFPFDKRKPPLIFIFIPYYYLL